MENIVSELKCNQKVKDLVSTFYTSTDLTPVEVGRHVGMTEEQLEWIDRFWEPTFNESWLILDREEIKNWFCGNDTGKNAVDNFYKQILIKYFKEGEDYMKVTDDEMFSLNLRKTKTEGRPSKYYKVTGESLASLMVNVLSSIQLVQSKLAIKDSVIFTEKLEGIIARQNYQT